LPPLHVWLPDGSLPTTPEFSSAAKAPVSIETCVQHESNTLVIQDCEHSHGASQSPGMKLKCTILSRALTGRCIQMLHPCSPSEQTHLHALHMQSQYTV